MLTLGVLLFGRGPSHVSKSAAGRIILVGCAVSAVIALNPGFHNLATGLDTAEYSFYSRAPIIGCVLLWLAALVFKRPLETVDQNSVATLETLLKKPSVRVNLFVAALLVLPAVTLMSGMHVRAAIGPAIFAGALLLALRGLFTLARSTYFAGAIGICVLLASGVCAWLGWQAYADLQREVSNTVASMQAGRSEEAAKDYDVALKMTDKLRTNGPRIEMESGVALQLERMNQPQNALGHWQFVANLLKVDQLTFPPIRRVRCSMGDSLPPWRMLVYEGFPSISTPELAPGIMRLAEATSDVRSKLLAALLAWEKNAPEAERRKLLEAVQAVSPGEPSSLNLLKRLGKPIKEVPMWLPKELIVATVPTYASAQGTIEETGEVCSVVCLNAGHWEMSLRAQGTPLHEEWPIVRVEMNGLPLATTQVNKSVEHDVPFTFDVTRNDIFKLRIIFQNREDDIEGGRAARRGLTISGIKFSQGK